MTKQIARWKPARWTPALAGVPAFLQSADPVELTMGALGGFLGGLVSGKAVGEVLKVTPPMATAILATVSIGVPLILGPKNLSKSLSNILYGVGLGLAGSTAFRIVQAMLAAPVAPAAATP